MGLNGGLRRPDLLNLRYRIERMVPRGVELVHGPGCPVCVTSLEMIDKAHAIPGRKKVIFTSFGNVLRGSGSRAYLLTLKSRRAYVGMVYSTLDALRIARDNASNPVVFFGSAFERTAPSNAMPLYQVRRQAVMSFSRAAVSHVLMPLAIAAILQARCNRVQVFLGPGHVCAAMGYWEDESQCARNG